MHDPLSSLLLHPCDPLLCDSLHLLYSLHLPVAPLSLYLTLSHCGCVCVCVCARMHMCVCLCVCDFVVFVCLFPLHVVIHQGQRVCSLQSI